MLVGVGAAVVGAEVVGVAEGAVVTVAVGAMVLAVGDVGLGMVPV
ncbi:MAG TPA: hypothetical protein VE617_10775 [Propionibacteriaceae bacterium]|nr:hypothetical protein [Propionibacteriaceae bacterium]